MVRKTVSAVLFAILLSRSELFAIKPGIDLGVNLGYNGGPGALVYAELSNVAENFPFSMRVAAGRFWRNPGNADSARKIFINDATNGVPEDHGHFWEFDFDLVYRTQKFKLYFGPRYAMFVGNFKFVGGNEDFDVKSDPWGIGGGAEQYYRINRKLSLTLGAGINYFFKSRLYAHDTSYDPDGEIINGRHDYTYEDADRAINQPRLEFKFVMGLRYQLK